MTLPYLFWLPFDHWETLRFLLPGVAILSAVIAASFMTLARRMRVRPMAAIVPVFLAVMLFGRSEWLLRDSSQWAIQSLEARYPLAGEWVNVNTPLDSVVMANQHSGSLRWYGKRQTIRWDFVEPQRLAATVSELQSHGAAVYVALEGDEVAMFEQRFKDVIGQLQVDHVGRVRNISFRRLSPLSAEQVVERQVGHHPHTDRQRRLVGEEQRRVVDRDLGRILILRRHAEEEEQPRHLLLKEREIFRGAGQRTKPHVVHARRRAVASAACAGSALRRCA